VESHFTHYYDIRQHIISSNICYIETPVICKYRGHFNGKFF